MHRKGGNNRYTMTLTLTSVQYNSAEEITDTNEFFQYLATHSKDKGYVQKQFAYLAISSK